MPVIYYKEDMTIQGDNFDEYVSSKKQINPRNTLQVDFKIYDKYKNNPHFEQTTQKVDFDQMLFDRQVRQIPIDYDKMNQIIKEDNGNGKGEKMKIKN